MRTTHALSAGILFLIAGSAANAQNLDFGITDEASYQAFRGAVAKAEHVRLDYTLQARPRVVAVAAGTLVYATANPHADAAQLAAFVMQYDDELAGFTEGDPDLARNSNFLAALRRHANVVVAGQDGFDPRVGGAVLDLLDVRIPEPDGFASMQGRMVDYDYARVHAFDDAPEWANVLVLGLSGRDLEGNANADIATVLQAYLEDQGFEPVPDGVDDERFEGVEAGLAMMPATYDEYAAELEQVDQLALEDTALYQRIAACMENVRSENEALVAEIDVRMDTAPTVIEAAENMTVPEIVDEVVAEYRDDRLAVSADRALISWNALILLQADQQAAGDFATVARDFTDIQLETNDTLAKTKAGIETVSGLATFAVGIATGSPSDVIGGLTDYALGALEMADLFGAFDSPPAPEEQIFEQLVEVRQQIEDMQAQMNQRFDNIEAQLNVIYDAVATGFNAIGDQIGDLQASVDALSLDMAVVRASLDRIEDALWGVAEDVLLYDLTLLTNDILDYRDDNAVDLPYSQTNPSFVSGASDLFSWATTISKNNTFAGDNPSQLTLDNASELLTQASIGRNINDLRVFPNQLGLPALFPVRVAGAAPWTQSASAYVQLAKESPWYFAYMYGAQQGEADLDAIIEVGEELAGMMANGRSQELFDTLFAGYDAVRQDISTVEANVIDAVRVESAVPYVDPFAGLVQPDVAAGLTGQIGYIPKLSGTGDNDNDLPLPDEVASWNFFLGDPDKGWNDAAAVTAALAYGRVQTAGGDYFGPAYLWNAVPGDLVDNDIVLDFSFDLYAYVNGVGALEEIVTRRLYVEVYANGGDIVQIGTETFAENLFVEDIFFWNAMRPHFTSGENLAGTVIEEIDGNGVPMSWVVVSDELVAAPTIGHEQLAHLQQNVWQKALDEPIVETLQDELADWVALLDAYATLSLPHLFEESSVARSAFRSVPGSESMALAVDVLGHYEDNLNDIENATFIESRFGPRWIYAQDSVNIALDTEAAGHGYIDWTLAELNELRDNAFTLAIPDTYGAAGQLVVDAADGLLANDVDQAFRTILVDVAEVTQPANGSVDVEEDGSFVYTPNAGFSGTDTFTYTSFTSVTNPPDAPAIVHSEPATVAIIVGEGGCAADVNGDGVLNILDFVAFQLAFQAQDPIADCDANGVFNVLDFVCYQQEFVAGCP